MAFWFAVIYRVTFFSPTDGLVEGPQVHNGKISQIYSYIKA